MGKNSLTRAVFCELINALDRFTTAVSNPGGVMVAGGVSEFEEMKRWQQVKWQTQTTREIRQGLKRLEEQKYIQIKKQGDQLLFKLTDRGTEEILKEIIIYKETILPRGEYCYVSFDIPESSRLARNALRLLLKQAACLMIHQSLWCTNRDIGEELAEFIRILDIKKWVHVVVGRALTTIDTQTLTKLDKKIQRKQQRLKSELKYRDLLKKEAIDKSIK